MTNSTADKTFPDVMISGTTDLINSNISLADTISAIKKRNMPKCVSFDEIKSAAYFGLVDAASKWKPERNVEFKIYATWRINGAIKDYLRELGWGSRKDPKKTEEVDEFTMSAPHLMPMELFSKIGDGLSEKAQQVIGLYYQQGWNQAEIADMLGVSKPRICEIISNSHDKIRKQWTKEELWAEVA